MRTLVAGALSLLAALLPAAAKSRAYTVDDLLKTEGFGQIVVAPGGRWLIFERRIARDGHPQIEENVASVARSRLYRVDLAMPGPAVPLVAIVPDAGDTLLGFSPEGQRAAIGRLEGKSWRLGIVTLRTGAVRWLNIAPDFYPSRTTLGWLSERELVVSGRTDGSAPWLFGDNGQEEADRIAAWDRTRAGKEVSVTAVGSGVYRPVTAPPPLMRLLKVDVDSGRLTELATGRFENMAVSPDGRHVALTALDEAIGITSLAPLSHATDFRRRRLLLVDTRSGRSWTPCPACDLPFFPPVWSSSGDHLLFYSRDAAQGWRDGEVWVVDLKAGALWKPSLAGLRPDITTIQELVDTPGLGWIGETPILYAHDENAVGRSDWYALGEAKPKVLTKAIAAPAWSPSDVSGHGLLQQAGRAWRLADGDTMPIGEGLTTLLKRPVPIAGDAMVPRPSFFGWRKLGDGGLSVVADAERPGFKPIVVDRGSQPVSASAEQQAVIATKSDAHGVIDLEIWRRDRPPVIAATVNRYLAHVDTAPPIRLRHVLPDGKPVTSWLYLPPTPSASGKPPLLVIEYPTLVFSDTPPSSYGPGAGGTFSSVATMTGHGYAVLLPSMPQLPAASDHPFDFAGQVLSAVDAAIATGQVDRERLALWGHSYGGYAAAIIASETDRFSAIIAANGIYDLSAPATMFSPHSQLHPEQFQPMISWAAWAERGQPQLGATRWTNPARYLVNNAVQRSNLIRTPMLIIGSDRDVVPLGSSEALFSSLYRQGKDAILLTYWNEQHALSSPANVRDSYARIFDWLDSHLAEPRAATEVRNVSPPKRRPPPANDAPSAP